MVDMPKRKRAKHAREHPRPIQEFTEWQEKQYLPGYWVGGRIPPFLMGKRPNPYGYVLIATGFLSLLILALIVLPAFLRPRGPQPLNLVQDLAVGLFFVVLQIVAGLYLLRRKGS